jgi:signal peptidase
MISTTAYRRPSSPAAPIHVHNGLRAAGRGASSLGIVLLSVAAALATVIAVATHISRDGGYTAFGHPVMTVLSGSMAPVIRTGDLIVDNPVTPEQASTLQPGQIISVREAPGSQSIITHRIVVVKVAHGIVSYVTKGDANSAPDSAPRPASDVVGVFRFAVPGGGYVLAALHRPLVLGLLLASPLLLLLAGQLFQVARRTDSPDDGDRRYPPARRDWPSPPRGGEGGRF